MGNQSQYRPDSFRPAIVAIMQEASSLKDLRTKLWEYMKVQDLSGDAYRRLSEEASQAVRDYNGPE